MYMYTCTCFFPEDRLGDTGELDFCIHFKVYYSKSTAQKVNLSLTVVSNGTFDSCFAQNWMSKFRIVSQFVCMAKSSMLSLCKV